MIELLHEIESARGVPVEWLCGALEEALQGAYRQHAGDVDALVSIEDAMQFDLVYREATKHDYPLYRPLEGDELEAADAKMRYDPEREGVPAKVDHLRSLSDQVRDLRKELLELGETAHDALALAQRLESALEKPGNVKGAS